jgi:hypothetical protein
VDLCRMSCYAIHGPPPPRCEATSRTPETPSEDAVHRWEGGTSGRMLWQRSMTRPVSGDSSEPYRGPLSDVVLRHPWSASTTLRSRLKTKGSQPKHTKRTRGRSPPSRLRIQNMRARWRQPQPGHGRRGQPDASSACRSATHLTTRSIHKCTRRTTTVPNHSATTRVITT